MKNRPLIIVAAIITSPVWLPLSLIVLALAAVCYVIVSIFTVILVAILEGSGKCEKAAQAEKLAPWLWD